MLSLLKSKHGLGRGCLRGAPTDSSLSSGDLCLRWGDDGACLGRAMHWIADLVADRLHDGRAVGHRIMVCMLLPCASQAITTRQVYYPDDAMSEIEPAELWLEFAITDASCRAQR